MLSFIKGTIAEIGADYVVLENHGIGYLIYTPASVLDGLPSRGESVQMHTYMYVREDQLALYGFLTRDDLQIFKLLIGVSGVGPKVGVAVLASMSPSEFSLMAGDARAISKAPGIGPKTAQKLIIELKDKLKLEDVFETPDAAAADIPDVSQGAKKEAMMALVSLGYSETEAFRAMQKIEASDSMDSETLLKLALKQMLTF